MTTELRKLKFDKNGSFKLLQFTDTHNSRILDERTKTAMDYMIDETNPDLVLITGDTVPTGDIKSLDDLKRSIAQNAIPMENRSIPWAITFGNHETDGLAELNITKDDMLKMFMEYPHNINTLGPADIDGSGNDLLLIESSESTTPIFAVWLIDSNSYAPDIIGGVEVRSYAWVCFSQVRWYWDTSIELEKTYGRKIPSLMFMHIPLREFNYYRDFSDFTGEINENPAPSKFNSGLFTAALERGDVKGIFAGHEHINTFVGNWYGITLGYSGGIGYDTYGIKSDDETEQNRLRGARIFYLNENEPETFKTEYLLIGDKIK